MPDSVPVAVRHSRVERLRLLSDRLTVQHSARFIGRTLPVLIETEARRAGDGMLYIYGHTANHLRVAVPCPDLDRANGLLNRLLPVQLDRRDGQLIGDPVGLPDEPPVLRPDLHVAVRPDPRP